MKIALGWSCTFAKEMQQAQKELENQGHEVYATQDLDAYANDESIKQNFEQELKISIEYDIIRSFFKKIEKSDSFLILNYEKNNIPGYLGANVLMEIGVAYYLNKKIFLLNPVDKNQKYALEIAIINPTILNNDLTKIPKI